MTFDFGRNTHQLQINFRFDYLSLGQTQELVRYALIEKRQFKSVGKDDNTNETVLTVGDGTPDDPLFQLRLLPNRIVLWVGWGVSYERWQAWRSTWIENLASELKGLPVDFIANVMGQHLISIPVDRLKTAREIDELKAVLEFYGRFVPEAFLSRAAAQVVFGDEAGRDQIAWSTGISDPPDHESVTFAVQRNAFESDKGVAESLKGFAGMCDELMDPFHENFLSLIIKQA